MWVQITSSQLAVCHSEMQLLLYVGGLGIGIKHDTLKLVDGIIMGVSQESFSKVNESRAFEQACPLLALNYFILRLN